MRSWTDQEVENILGNLLRWGVIIAGAIVLIGGIFYIFRYGSQLPHYHIFKGEPPDLKSVTGIIREVITLHPRAVIQLGLLLLIATPVARVVLSIYGFVHQKDKTYVVITFIVLFILVVSLTGLV